MKIKEINIQRYGPLSDIKWKPAEDIQPVYGPNESGKTLIVEAIMKMLVGSGKHLPTDAKRVDESPEGYMILETGEGEEKIDYDNPLSETLDVEPHDLLNTLIVRNTDLRIDEEDQFYERVSDKLSGLWTEGIRNIEDKLKESGRLTSTLKLKNNSPMNYPKEQLGNAEQLRKEVKDYLKEAEREGIEDLESKKLSAESKRKELEERKKVLKVGDLESKIQKVKEERAKLKNLPDDDVISGLREDLGGVSGLSGKSESIERNMRLYKIFTIGSVIGSLASLISIPFVGNMSLVILGIFLISSVISGSLYRRENSRLSESANDIDRVVRRVQQKGIEVEGESQMKKLGNIRSNLTGLEEKRRSLKSDIAQNLGVLKDKLEIPEDFDEKETLERAEGKLKGRKEELDSEEKLESDEEELKSIEEELKEINENVKKWEQNLKEHRRTLDDFSAEANKLDFNNFAGEKLNLEIDNLDSLEALIKKLDKFIEKIEKDRDHARKAIRIFRSMEGEEERKISELFGEDSETTRIFKEITDERYEKVDYDQDEREIFVKNESDEVLYPSVELSGSKGTVNQLYLSIRMALAKEVLESSSFFVLDDALLFSDNERVDKQREILNAFSDSGWQILYLTSDSDDAEDLCDLTGNERIELEERL